MTDLNKTELQDESIPPSVSPSVIELLKNTRISQGYSLEEIASHLKFSLQYLIAIEKADLSSFPERVYILGFVYSYARFLKLNPNECIERFKIEVLQDPVSLPLSFPAPIMIDSSPNQKLIIFSGIALVLFLLIGYIVWHWTSSSENILIKDPSPNISNLENKENIPTSQNSSVASGSSLEIRPQPTSFPPHPDIELKEEPVEEIKSEEVLSLPQQNIEKNPYPVIKEKENSSLALSTFEDKTLEFEFLSASWVQIKNSVGQVIVEKIFQPGEKYKILESSNHYLRTGNAGGIKIKIGKNNPKVLGKPGEIISQLSLNFSDITHYLESHPVK